MFSYQFGQRISTCFIQYGAKARVTAKVRQKIVTVGLPQAIDARIAALTVNVAVFIAMPSVQAGFLHGNGFSTIEASTWVCAKGADFSVAELMV